MAAPVSQSYLPILTPAQSSISIYHPSYIRHENVHLLRPSFHNAQTTPPPLVSETGGLERSGQRLISLNGKTKIVAFFFFIFLLLCFFMKYIFFLFFSFFKIVKVFWLGMILWYFFFIFGFFF